MTRALFVLLLTLLVLTPHARTAEAVAGIGPLVTLPVSSSAPLTNLLVDLRADQVVSPTNGQPFSSWQDLSNGGAVYTQATPARQLSWNATDALYGGRPSVTSNAGAFIDTFYAPINTAPYTIYAALNTTSVSAYQIVVSDAGDATENGYNAGDFYFYAPSSLSTGGVTTGPHALAWVRGSSTSTIYEDSSASPVLTGVLTSHPGGSPIVIGYTGATDGLQGNYAEILVYNGGQSQSQISQVFEYLGQRYGHAWN